MNIKKFTGKSQEEATQKAKADLGPNAVVMNVKEIKPKGLFKLFKSSTFEVTAAVEDQPLRQIAPQQAKPVNVNKAINAYASADKAQAKESANAPKNNDKAAEAFTEAESDKQLEKKIDDLQQMFEKQFKSEEEKRSLSSDKSEDTEKDNGKKSDTPIIRLIYNALIDNEVDERYANQLMEEVQKNIKNSSELDYVLSNVYQKLILKFGQPRPITLGNKQPKVVFLIGPTGVGKTTTIAKIASKFKVELGKSVALITSDTYRIAATDQLRVYANILDIPLSIVYSAEEMGSAIEEFNNYDLILVDTAGFSHKNREQKSELRDLLEGTTENIDSEIYLVLSATTKYKDLLRIVASYAQLTDYKLIFTKLDETECYGNLLNIKLHTGAEMSYLTTGQNVPDDIEVFNAQKIVKQLLGGR